MAYKIFKEQLPFLKGPYSYEFVASRSDRKWHISDKNDDPAGWADSEEEAQAVVAHLNCPWKVAAP